MDTSGNVVRVNADGGGRRILVRDGTIPRYRLEIAGSGAWSSGDDPELLLIANTTAVCIDSPCGTLPESKLYMVPESGGKPTLIAGNLGVIQSASWFGTGTNKLILSADDETGARTGFQRFSMDELTVAPKRNYTLGFQRFDVDATTRDGYIVSSTGNREHDSAGERVAHRQLGRVQG